MRGEISREPHYFMSSEWINKPSINLSINLSGWPINRKGQTLGRLNAGSTNKAKKLLARMEKEGRK